MRLTFGGSPIGDQNATKIAPGRELLRNRAGIGYGFKHTYPIQCSFACSGQADCKTKMDAVEAALQLQAQDLLFLNDDGSRSTNSVFTASTLSGVRCIRYEWDSQPGGQFLTWRALSATFEWETSFSPGSGFLIDFQETVTIDNPPSRFVTTEAINGATPVSRLTVLYPKSTAVQFGFAVGYSAYPVLATIAPPLWSGTPPLKSQPFTRVNPIKIGASGNKEYRIEWRYEFESPTPLTAYLPHTW